MSPAIQAGLDSDILHRQGRTRQSNYVRITCVKADPVLVLASSSPRRKELLGLCGWEFDVRPADVDERPLPGEAPGEYVLRLSQSKARACAVRAAESPVILAADTAVVVDDDILGKPRSEDEAVEMLRRLRGRTHQVATGLAVLRSSDGKMVTDLCVTDVPMRAYREKEIESYLASRDPLDKAGAYAIQHPGFHPVRKLRGCYASVMGLPLCHLVRTLRKLEVAPLSDVPANCQAALHYRCPISSAVLRGEAIG